MYAALMKIVSLPSGGEGCGRVGGGLDPPHGTPCGDRPGALLATPDASFVTAAPPPLVRSVSSTVAIGPRTHYGRYYNICHSEGSRIQHR